MLSVPLSQTPRNQRLNAGNETLLEADKPGVGTETRRDPKFGNRKVLFGLCLAYDCIAPKETIDRNKAFK